MIELWISVSLPQQQQAHTAMLLRCVQRLQRLGASRRPSKCLASLKAQPGPMATSAASLHPSKAGCSVIVSSEPVSGGSSRGDSGGCWAQQLTRFSSAAARPCDSGEQSSSSWCQSWDLYSLHATELMQHQYLQVATSVQSAAESQALAAKAQEQGDSAVAHKRLEMARVAVEELAAEAIECEASGNCPMEPDFYEATHDFQPEQQLVLRSAWLCAGASSLASMRERLQERIRFLEDLEADGWQLEAPVDDEYACLHNEQPKPVEERRLVQAWDIVERWELGIDLEQWPSSND